MHVGAPMYRRICFLLALAVAGCGSSNSSNRKPATPGKASLSVVATVGMAADLVRGVGGDLVEVGQLMGSGVDPHLYKATRDDLQQILAADAVFYVGLMLEGKMADSLVKVARKKPVFAVTEALDEAALLEPSEFAGHFDPHVWMDVELWSQCTAGVAQALGELDPEHQDEYLANAEAYREQLRALHDYGKQAVASIPTDRRVLVTSHDAFNYFGRAYGLEVQGVQGVSTESEAGLQRINELVDLIVQRRVQAVFVESSVSSKNIEALVEGARSRGGDVSVGGELFSDAMGPPQTYEGTYIGMLDHNITTVARALGGEAPERGLHGRLSEEAGR